MITMITVTHEGWSASPLLFKQRVLPSRKSKSPSVDIVLFLHSGSSSLLLGRMGCWCLGFGEHFGALWLVGALLDGRAPWAHKSWIKPRPGYVQLNPVQDQPHWHVKLSCSTLRQKDKGVWERFSCVARGAFTKKPIAPCICTGILSWYGLCWIY